MDKFVIKGGNPLQGEVVISSAKNAVLPILIATLLCEDKCIIENVPDISDVSVTFRIIYELGGSVTMKDKTTYEIDTTNVNSVNVPYELTKCMRSSCYFMGALLSRFGSARVSMPGGCNFGPRPIDLHLKAFESLGAEISVENGIVNIHSDYLIGNQIFFDNISVGATINSMLAAVKAQGITIIENAAKEPHVVDLANFLNSMGADVRGAGTDVIKIHGVKGLHGADYSIIPDQIEAGTFMIAAAATRGNVLIKNVIPKHLEAISSKLIKIGATVEEFDDSIRVIGPDIIQKCNIKTLPHPGFPTDMQPQMVVLLSIAQGTSIVTETIFDNRFKYVDELRRMGASIQVDGKVAVIEGVTALTAAPVRATDLRAGVALIIAGLVCQNGFTEIEDIQFIERGYEDIETKFRSLGADIKKVRIPGPSSAMAV